MAGALLLLWSLRSMLVRWERRHREAAENLALAQLAMQIKAEELAAQRAVRRVGHGTLMAGHGGWGLSCWNMQSGEAAVGAACHL